MTIEITEIVRARGHRNVTALHPSTFEIARDPEISPTADCIIAVGADKAAATLSREFRARAARDDAVIIATIACGEQLDTVTGWGSPLLTFADPASMVFRVSDYVCGRTVMINADTPAARLNRALVGELATGKTVTVKLSIRWGERPQPSLDTLFEEE